MYNITLKFAKPYESYFEENAVFYINLLKKLKNKQQKCTVHAISLLKTRLYNVIFTTCNIKVLKIIFYCLTFFIQYVCIFCFIKS